MASQSEDLEGQSGGKPLQSTLSSQTVASSPAGDATAEQDRDVASEGPESVDSPVDTSRSLAEVESMKSTDAGSSATVLGLPPPKAPEKSQRGTKPKMADMTSTISRESSKEGTRSRRAARPKGLAPARPPRVPSRSGPAASVASQQLRKAMTDTEEPDAGAQPIRVIGSDGIAGNVNVRSRANGGAPILRTMSAEQDMKPRRTRERSRATTDGEAEPPSPRSRSKKQNSRGEGSPARDGAWMRKNPSVGSRATWATSSKPPKRKKDLAVRSVPSASPPRPVAKPGALRAGTGDSLRTRDDSPRAAAREEARRKMQPELEALDEQGPVEQGGRGLKATKVAPAPTAPVAGKLGRGASADTNDSDSSSSSSSSSSSTSGKAPPQSKPGRDTEPELKGAVKTHKSESDKAGRVLSIDDRPEIQHLSSDSADVGHHSSMSSHIHVPRLIQRGVTGMMSIKPQKSAVFAAKATKDFSDFWFSSERFRPSMTRSRPLNDPPKEPAKVSQYIAKKLDEHKVRLESSQPTTAPGKAWQRLFLRIHRFWDVDGDGKISFTDLMSARTSGTHVYDDLTSQHRPYFTIGWMLICATLWTHHAWRQGQDFMWTPGGASWFFPDQTMLKIDQNCVDTRWQWWRLVTYQFDHGHIMHIGFNSMMLFGMGLPLEGFHGFWRTFLIFNLGVVGGGLAFLVAVPHFPVIGMSGGCYSLIGMQLASLVMNWKQVRYRRPTLISLLGSAALDIAFVFYGHLIFGGMQKSVAHSAHFGGYMSGFFCAIVFGRNLHWSPTERFVQGAVLMGSIMCFIFCVTWLSQWPPRAFFSHDPWCWFRYVRGLPDVDRGMCVRCFSPECILKWSQFNTTRANPLICTEKGLWYYSE